MSQPASSAFTASGSSHMARVEPDRIIVRGLDLCRDVIGQQSFTAYFLFLLTGSASEKLVKAVDATLIAIAEHGLVPSVQAARMTLAAAPDAMQGAVAAGLAGCGPVILGASEAAGRLLITLLAQARAQQRPLEDLARGPAIPAGQQTSPAGLRPPGSQTGGSPCRQASATRRCLGDFG